MPIYRAICSKHEMKGFHAYRSIFQNRLVCITNRVHSFQFLVGSGACHGRPCHTIRTHDLHAIALERLQRQTADLPPVKARGKNWTGQIGRTHGCPPWSHSLVHTMVHNPSIVGRWACWIATVVETLGSQNVESNILVRFVRLGWVTILGMFIEKIFLFVWQVGISFVSLFIVGKVRTTTERESRNLQQHKCSGSRNKHPDICTTWGEKDLRETNCARP